MEFWGDTWKKLMSCILTSLATIWDAFRQICDGKNTYKMCKRRRGRQQGALYGDLQTGSPTCKNTPFIVVRQNSLDTFFPRFFKFSYYGGLLLKFFSSGATIHYLGWAQDVIYFLSCHGLDVWNGAEINIRSNVLASEAVSFLCRHKVGQSRSSYL